MTLTATYHDMPPLAGDFDGFVGISAPMQRLYDRLMRAATSDAPVLLTGPTGSGKELAAQSLHRRSRRAAAPLIALNCAALPRDMIESELFGHRRGAFTGAAADHAGILSRADGGTLFLDEITETPPALQAKLLRVIESGRYTPLGGTQEKHANIRVIAASNRAPAAAMAEGHLRPDLYYRLSGLHIELPPLSERGPQDLQRLTLFLIGKISRVEARPLPTLSAAALTWLSQQPFAGNVRELENMLRHALVFHDTPLLEIAHFKTTSESTVTKTAAVTLADAERAHIEAALTACKGNISAAARRLGIDASTLHRKRKSWHPA